MEKIEVKEFKKIYNKLKANAMQLFEGVGLFYLITDSIRFVETESGMVCKVKHLQRSQEGLKEIEKVFVRFYREDDIGFFGEEENGEKINFFLIKSMIVGDD